MTPFLEKIQQTIVMHDMAQPQDRILAGVSGGADSVALLLVLRELGYEVVVGHLNHGLRGEESDQDEQFVAELAASLGVRFVSARVALAGGVGNLEAAGRFERKRFFSRVAKELCLTKVALAHNREDRVETFMLHLMRGAGIGGLVSMAPKAGTLIRPLIETSRADIEHFLVGRGQRWRTDRTNQDIRFSRNRMRLETIPQLAAAFNSRFSESLARTVALLQDEDAWMSAIAGSWLDTHSGVNGIEVGALVDLPVGMVRRVVREAIRRAGSALTDLTFDHVEAVRELLHPGKSGKVVPLPGGLRAAREFERLTFLPDEGDFEDFSYNLSIPGETRIPELRTLFRATCMETEGACSLTALSSGSGVLVDGDRLGPHVTIRNWKSGDYYRPAGSVGGKLKKLFQKARVPRSQRRKWPVFTSESAIVWVTSFPVSREFIPDNRSKKIVAFEALPD